MIGETRGAVYDQVERIIISPDGQHRVYDAKKDKERSTILLLTFYRNPSTPSM
jgi:hypothetical protein